MTNQQSQAVANQHKLTWERLFSILISSKSGDSTQCHELSQLPPEQREEYVERVWGMAALDKVRPLLRQVVALEEQAERIESQGK